MFSKSLSHGTSKRLWRGLLHYQYGNPEEEPDKNLSGMLFRKERHRFCRINYLVPESTPAASRVTVVKSSKARAVGEIGRAIRGVLFKKSSKRCDPSSPSRRPP